MRLQHLMLLTFAVSGLSAQSSHSISGRVHLVNGEGIVGCEVWCQNSRGQIQKSRSNSFGQYRFISVPLGPATIWAIQPKAFEFFGTLTRKIAPPFSDCSRDVVLDLPFIPQTMSYIFPLPRFANTLPPGTFHFHPNAEPQWIFE